MNKTTVFIRQNDEPFVPITIRAVWQSDGAIKPLMYWTPDGSCYHIKAISSVTPMAFLKDCGEGLQFKINSELAETPEPYSEDCYVRHDTYLYLADNWFCGKNFIDDRYGHACKEYIPVILDIFPDGDYELIYFTVQGMRYMVEKTLEIEPRGSFNAGGIGIWHKVDARLINAENDECLDIHNCVKREAAIYFEVNKWFVSLRKT